ncbi:hypothetical protein ADUPG1_012519 [Aduncisulcus paluster]|uniref:Uncharacterized protein n=1 Tax=Aduncisulcus paluster TaxID=2918883 RepID=A0ABQ5JZP7_9EUKA|nr:hypothetical protein ADUPG1_012519 [Aduncisulcus paluster]
MYRFTVLILSILNTILSNPSIALQSKCKICILTGGAEAFSSYCHRALSPEDRDKVWIEGETSEEDDLSMARKMAVCPFSGKIEEIGS